MLHTAIRNILYTAIHTMLHTAICKNIFACLFSIHNIIGLSCPEQVCLMRLRLKRYFSQ